MNKFSLLLLSIFISSSILLADDDVLHPNGPFKYTFDHNSEKKEPVFLEIPIHPICEAIKGHMRLELTVEREIPLENNEKRIAIVKWIVEPHVLALKNAPKDSLHEINNGQPVLYGNLIERILISEKVVPDDGTPPKTSFAGVFVLEDHEIRITRITGATAVQGSHFHIPENYTIPDIGSLSIICDILAGKVT